MPVDLLRRYIREENQANNATLASLIKEALSGMDLTAENNIYIGDKKIESVITDMVIKKISSKIRNLQSAKGR